MAISVNVTETIVDTTVSNTDVSIALTENITNVELTYPGPQGIKGDTGATGAAGIIANTSLALEPGLLITGTITRNSSGIVTTAEVVWPDSDTGTYTSLTYDTATGAINSYQITKGTATYTQPAMTRDSSGAVTNRPAIVVN